MSVCADCVVSPTISAVPARHLTLDHVTAWSRIQEECGLLESPYLRPEFTRAVAAVRDDIEVGIVDCDGAPVAFLPFRRMSWGGGRPVGGWLSNFQALACDPAFDLDVIALLRACNLHSWQFNQLLAPPQCLQPFLWRSWDSPYADLSDGYEAYCDKLGSNRKRLTEFSRLQRKMAREVGQVRFEAHVNKRSVLRTLMDWKTSQYKRTRQRNIFASEWVCELLDLLLDCREESFSSLLSVLYAGSRIAAIAYWLRSGPNLHGWFTAFDRDLSSYSPGIQLLLEFFRAAPSLGISRIDLGKGPEAYKRRFMTDATTVFEGTVDTSTLVSQSRRFWWQTKSWVRSSPLAKTARTSANLVRGVQGWLEMG